ncbi:MAG: NmrA family NAD(P)-binding protein, partial [Acidimicrobiales bacterium]
MSETTNLPETILVLGGTGKTGSRVAHHLAARGLPVRIGSRSGEPPFDWDDPARWAPVLDGVTSAYITYQPDLAFPGAAETVGAFARLAVEHGVRRLVLLSGRNEEGALRGEQAVRESGADWTIVRSSFFAQNFSEGFWVDAVVSGELAVPAGDVTEPFIDVDDVADIVVAALTEDGHRGQLYEVTGPRLLSFADVAAELSGATGREVRYVPVSSEDFVSALRAEGLPPDLVAGLAGLFDEVLDGRSSYLADGVQRALHRPPRDFADYARDAAASAAWRPAWPERRGG